MVASQWSWRRASLQPPVASGMATSPICVLVHLTQGKLSEDGKSVELEIEIEAKEGDRKESRELEYSVPL